MNCSFIVARYKPKGNIDSETNFKENVERGTFDPVAYNCSAVICQSEEEEQSQGLDSPDNKPHHNLIPVISRNADYQNEVPSNSKPQRLGNALGSRDSHGYMNTLERYSKQLSPSIVEHNFKQHTGESQQQYVSNGLKQDEGRPRSLVYRAKIPRVWPIKVL